LICLNIATFEYCKAREVTASCPNWSLFKQGVTLSLSSRSTSVVSTIMPSYLRKENKLYKLVEPKAFIRNLSDLKGGIGKVPYSSRKREERTRVAVSRWLREQLKSIISANKQDSRYNGLIHIISNTDYLIACYYMIKGKPGNMSKGW